MKYKLICTGCKHEIDDFGLWFESGQCCSKCGCKRAEISYNADYEHLANYFKGSPDSFWHYFDFLPLEEKENIVSCGEGAIPVETWDFLEKMAAKKYGINCKALVYRNDLNGGTNTFKDIAASLAASLFKEHGIKRFCVASTGNTATAYSKYLALAGVEFTVFVPNCINRDSVDIMRSFGQNVVIVDGDYAYAKKCAADFSANNGVLISAGNIDPIRVEAKRTMVFEFMRQLGKMPDVYMQAVSGGTGPIAVDKGVRELQNRYPEVTLPKMLMIQQDLCDPMVKAWEAAEKKGFPSGYERDYPVIESPQTAVSILSTGNPAMYPILAPIVKNSGGAFLRVQEAALEAYARFVYRERGVLLGPASIVCLLGFEQALKEQKIKAGETVLLNTGEGSERAQAFATKVKAGL
jgi:threonine synthase